MSLWHVCSQQLDGRRSNVQLCAVTLARVPYRTHDAYKPDLTSLISDDKCSAYSSAFTDTACRAVNKLASGLGASLCAAHTA